MRHDRSPEGGVGLDEEAKAEGGYRGLATYLTKPNATFGATKQ